MPKLRKLSGNGVVSILAKHGFKVHSQRGSHVKLRRMTPGGDAQTLTVPLHEDLDVGTLHAIFRQSSRFIPEDKLRADFYARE